MRTLTLFTLMLITPTAALAQMSKPDSVWLPLKPLIGSWIGTGEAPEGKGRYERTYQFVLNNKFIEVRNRSEYSSPQTYTHEDHGYISYDKARKKFVLRQFHGEGFVNQYVLESISPDGSQIVFVTESIENIPPGFRARETYTIGKDTLAEAFDLAEPDKDFAPYSKATFHRKK